VPDLRELWYAQERGDVGQWLDEHGWRGVGDELKWRVGSLWPQRCQE